MEKNNDKNKVVSITKKLELKSAFMGVASSEPLKRHFDQMKEHQKKESLPYGRFLQEMSKKFILKKASESFIKFKKEGKPSEVAHYFANDVAKSEAVIALGMEITKVGKLFEEGKLTETHMLNLLKLSGSFTNQVKFIDRNSMNKYSHFLTDMEMLSELSAEKKEELFDIKE